MATKLPTKIKLASWDIAVKREAILKDGLLGYYNPKDMVIVVDSSLGDIQTLETFWHELIHAINDYNRLFIEIKAEVNQNDGSDEERIWMLEERVTENFAKVFMQVIKDNNLLDL